MMHTEIHCETLENVDTVKAIRAIHQAYLQLLVINNMATSSDNDFDNGPVIEALHAVMIDAGHIGFTK